MRIEILSNFWTYFVTDWIPHRLNRVRLWCSETAQAWYFFHSAEANALQP